MSGQGGGRKGDRTDVVEEELRLALLTRFLLTVLELINNVSELLLSKGFTNLFGDLSEEHEIDVSMEHKKDKSFLMPTVLNKKI